MVSCYHGSKPKQRGLTGCHSLTAAGPREAEAARWRAFAPAMPVTERRWVMSFSASFSITRSLRAPSSAKLFSRLRDVELPERVLKPLNMNCNAQFPTEFSPDSQSR